MKSKLFSTILIAFICVYISNKSFSQNNKIDPALIQMFWNFASPYIMNIIKDPLAKEIINSAVPGIIQQNVKQASLGVCDAIFKIKKIRVANPQYLLLLENDITSGIEQINKNDLSALILTLTNVTSYTYTYIENGNLSNPKAKLIVNNANENEITGSPSDKK